jgi:hypothetical protein
VTAVHKADDGAIFISTRLAGRGWSPKRVLRFKEAG